MAKPEGGRVAVVDYGVVNLRNIVRGLEFVGAEVFSSADLDQIVRADRVVLPGVGAFGSGLSELKDLGLDQAISEFVESGKPMLGICLGMQLLLDKSFEYGEHGGLGFIPGDVVPIPKHEGGTIRRKIPHIGWNTLRPHADGASWTGSCMNSLAASPSCYFVHSFMAVPKNSKHILATCEYEGTDIVAAIKMNNITGVQFHPERSGPTGLSILKEFLLQ